MRKGNNDYDRHCNLRNGFDYDLQVWVVDYIIQPCGHSTTNEYCCSAFDLAWQDIRDAREVYLAL